MLPRWHILFGALFTLVVWIAAPSIHWFFLLLLFLATFLIDFDHYTASVCKTKKLGLSHSFKYHDNQRDKILAKRERGIREKEDFHVFHTIEFHVFVALLGLVWIGFFYIFVGMVFHSLLDLIYLVQKDFLYLREYSLINWLRKKIF